MHEPNISSNPAISGNSLFPEALRYVDSGAADSDADARHLEQGEGAKAAAYSPRLVTTGEKISGSTQFGVESLDDLPDPERFTVEPGKNCEAFIIYHPVPDETVDKRVAHIDWLSFTLLSESLPDGGNGQQAILSWLFLQLKAVFGISQMIQKLGKKFNGYQDTYELKGRDGNPLGLLGIGGEHQRGTVHVSLNAGCCALVPDWKNAANWGESLKARITRVDLAHDDFEGKTINIETARQWHQENQFVIGGRPPKAKLIDDLGTGDGKTLYIGGRPNGKLFRFYEKGKQLGAPQSPWVRVELELHNKSRLIPWDVLTRPGQYLAGSAPCLAFLSELQSKIRTVTKAVTISFDRAVENAKRMVGKTINVMLQAFSGDYIAVVNTLKRDGVPRRLENYADFLPQVFAGGIS